MLSSGIKPNEASITAVARLAATKGDGDYAFGLVKSMNMYNLLPRLRTYDPALFCFCEKLEVNRAYEVEDHMETMGVDLEEAEIAALLKVSMDIGKEDRVYRYLHKLRKTVRSVKEETGKIIEDWFKGFEGNGVELDVALVKEAVTRNGRGWHGLGWIGKGKYVVHRGSVDLFGKCCCCGEQLACVDISDAETERFLNSVATLAMEREAMANFIEFQVRRPLRRIAIAALDYASIYGSRACSVMDETRPMNGICKFNEGGVRSIKTQAARQGSRKSTAIVKKPHTAPRRLTSNKPKTAGRNSAGHITAFHRGGGSKRLYRKIDLKRNTPSIGVVERIEYDPNRSSNIALVRWSEGMNPLFQRKPRAAESFAPPSEILAPKEANIRGLFSFSSMSRETSQGNVGCFTKQPKTASVMVGLPTEIPALSNGSISNCMGSKSSASDVFLSAFSSPKAVGGTGPLSSSSSFSLPRVAIAGAKPVFYAPLMRENGGVKNTFSLTEIKKWKASSSFWAHRLKRKAAVSWHCTRCLHNRGLAGIGELVEQKF